MDSDGQPLIITSSGGERKTIFFQADHIEGSNHCYHPTVPVEDCKRPQTWHSYWKFNGAKGKGPIHIFIFCKEEPGTYIRASLAPEDPLISINDIFDSVATEDPALQARWPNVADLRVISNYDGRLPVPNVKNK